MDQIIIKGLKVFAYHGVNPSETENGQEFELDIVIDANLDKARKSDDINDTVNYAAVRKTVTRVMTERPYKLIERAADEVAKSILKEFCGIEHVEVLLKKPNAPMSCEFDYVAVRVRI